MNQKLSLSPLNRLIESWSKLKLPDSTQLTGLEIHEILWLALQQQKYAETDGSGKADRVQSFGASEVGGKQAASGDRNRPSPPPSVPTSISGASRVGEKQETSGDRNRPSPPPSVPTSSEKEVEIIPQPTQSATSTTDKPMTIPVPDASAVGEPLNLARALRPLMRQVPSEWEMVLDEEATAEQMAELRLRLPVLKPALQTWLDLALVVDESSSMSLWQTTLKNLTKLLTHYGVFRDVRLYSLRTNGQGKIVLKPKLGKPAEEQRDCQFREIIAPSGDRLILVVTDCVGEHWYEAEMRAILQDWSKSCPMALLQMLPERLWSRTALEQGILVRFGSLTPGMANQHLLIKEVFHWKDLNLDAGFKVPVCTLDPEVTSGWSKMVAGKSQVKAPGLVFPAVATPGEEGELNNHQQDAPGEETEDLSPQLRVEQFRRSASPLARQLASLLSASPVITLPVVRLIQKNFLPKSGQIHLAEVFLGGLLEPEVEITAEINPDTVIFKFIEEEIRYRFLEVAPVSSSVQIIETISADFAARLGLTLQEFEAFLRLPGEKQVKGTYLNPFARVKGRILRRLGGKYARLARELDNSSLTQELERSLSNYAITMGITRYQFFPNNQYAARNADVMGNWFHQSVFEKVDIMFNKNYEALQNFLGSHYQPSTLTPQDTLWFYFSGHSLTMEVRDYLLLSDSKLEALENTAISVSELIKLLLQSGAGRLVLVLDANRGVRWWYGSNRLKTNPPEEIAQRLIHESGIDCQKQELIVFYACLPDEAAYEIVPLEHGSFTYAFLEAMKHWRKENVSVQRLFQRLRQRVQELNQQYNRGRQTPELMAEPTSLRELVLLPAQTSISLKVCHFEVVTVNRRGEEIKRETYSTRYFTEDLGNSITLDLIYISGGKFMMGSPEGEGYDREKPQHQVTVQPFFMGKFPVTQVQWRAIASRNDLRVNRDLKPEPSWFKGDDNRPVEQVDWYDAVEFCDRLSKLTGRDYRLPSEAEWEYACRAGTITPFYFGETITDKLANCDASYTYAEEPKGKYREETTPVGQFSPNAFGLYDMHGNVLEWCADPWHENYKGAPTDGSVWQENGNDNRSPLRGGSWYCVPDDCRSANHDYYYARDIIPDFVGFRVACGVGRT